MEAMNKAPTASERDEFILVHRADLRMRYGTRMLEDLVWGMHAVTAGAQKEVSVFLSKLVTHSCCRGLSPQPLRA